MKELNVALTKEELERLLGFREVNMKKSEKNINENLVMSYLPSKIKGKDITWERQYIFGYRILDFYCPQLKIAIEVDGIEHNKDYDSYRDEYLFRVEGVVTFRVRNQNIPDIEKVLNTLKDYKNKSFTNKNSVFKDVLGRNPSLLLREELSRLIPFGEDYSLLGKFLLSIGYKSEHQPFKFKKMSYWRSLVRSLKSGNKPVSSNTGSLYQTLKDVSNNVYPYHRMYLVGEYSTDQIDNFRKYKTVTDEMIVYRKDNTFRYRGVEGSGLKDFLSLLGVGLENKDLAVRVFNPHREYGSQSETRQQDIDRVTFREYLIKRVGVKGNPSITGKELKAFGIPNVKGWASKYENSTISVAELIPLIDSLIKKDLSLRIINNLKRYREELLVKYN